MNATEFVSRLEARQTGPGRWIARCPSHKDRSPSLGVREAEDGKILINCRAGCAPSEVVGALGLGLQDLFPDSPRYTKGDFSPPEARPIPAIDILRCCADDLLVGFLVCRDVASGSKPPPGDVERLLQSAVRLQQAHELATGKAVNNNNAAWR